MAAFIPFIVTQGVYTGIISTISTVTVSTCNVVKSIYTHQNPDVTKIIQEFDIERRLKLIESVTKKIVSIKGNSQNIDMIESVILMDDPVSLCLKYIHASIKYVHDDLEAINVKVEKHKNKWFNSWRTLNVAPLIQQLKIHSNILNERFEDLTKILMLFNNIGN